jgi:hypothetical protein
MRLMYSGRDFARIYERQDQISFLDGHVRAFAHFDGVPARVAYDYVARHIIAKRRSGCRPSSFFLANPRASITSLIDLAAVGWRKPTLGQWQGQFQGQPCSAIGAVLKQVHPGEHG